MLARMWRVDCVNAAGGNVNWPEQHGGSSVGSTMKHRAGSQRAICTPPFITALLAVAKGGSNVGQVGKQNVAPPSTGTL